MLSDDVLRQHCIELFPHVQTRAILLYGSFAEGRATASSDYDLLCVCGKPRVPPALVTCQGRMVDVLFQTQQAVAAQISPQQWRRNTVLYALKYGRPIHDPEGRLHTLQGEAERLWAQGTGRPQDTDGRTAYRAAKLLNTAAAAVAHAEAGRLPLRMAECKLDQMMIHLFELVLYIQGLWAFPPWVMLRLPDARYAPAQEFMRRYFDAASLKARCETLVHLAQACLPPAENL